MAEENAVIYWGPRQGLGVDILAARAWPGRGTPDLVSPSNPLARGLPGLPNHSQQPPWQPSKCLSALLAIAFPQQRSLTTAWLCVLSLPLSLSLCPHSGSADQRHTHTGALGGRLLLGRTSANAATHCRLGPADQLVRVAPGTSCTQLLLTYKIITIQRLQHAATDYSTVRNLSTVVHVYSL